MQRVEVKISYHSMKTKYRHKKMQLLPMRRNHGKSLKYKLLIAAIMYQCLKSINKVPTEI